MWRPPLTHGPLSRIGAAVIGLLCVWASAPLARQGSGQYVHQHWQRTDGLPQSTVAALAQTPDGYLWMGTQAGLVRFDGTRFTVFDGTNTPELGVSDVLSLHADRAGSLWIGTAGGGLVRLTDGQFTVFGSSHGLPHQVITAITEDASGVLWVGSEGGGIGRLPANARTFVTIRDGLPGEAITALAADAADGIWIGTHRGLARWQAGRLSTMTTGDGLPSNDVRGLKTTRDGSVWVGTERGVARVHEGRLSVYTAKDGLASEFVRSFVEDRDGVLWMGTVGGGLHRMVNGRIERAALATEPPLGDIRALLQDREGNVWIGTNTDGLHRISEAIVLTYGVPEGVSHDVALATLEDAAGTMWVGTYGGGLNRYRDGRWTAYTVRDGLPSAIVLSLAVARGGGLWIGTRSGVVRLRDGTGAVRFEALAALPPEPVLSLIEDRAGALWVGTRTGVKRVIGNAVRAFTTKDGLASEVILAIFERNDGTLLVGTEGGGLSRFTDEQFVTDPQMAAGAEIVYGISEDAQGGLWLASNRGVARVHGGTARPLPISGFRSAAYRVIEDGRGYVWISSDHGLLHMRLRDVNEFEAGRLDQIPVVHLTEADGMRTSEVNGGIQPAGWLDRGGRVWFPTNKGVVVADSSRMPADLPPPVLVEEIRFDDALAPHQPLVTAGPGVRSLEFQYTAAAFRAAGKIQFRHRLDGYDPDWVEAGSRRTAYYTNIPPGDYRFQVAARIAGGDWSDGGSIVALRLRPYWYQTRTFYALAIVSAGLLVLGLHRVRVRGLKARGRELAMLAEERRLALDALRESEARFRMLFDNMREGVYRRSKSGELVLANRAYVEMLGYDSLEELAAVPADDLYAGPAGARPVREALAQSGEARHCDVLLRRRDGRIVAALESGHVARNALGEIAYCDGLVVDVSARRDLEEQVRQLQKMEIVGRLAGAVAHDFNNLLTPIIGYADMVAEALPASSKIRGDVEEIRRAAESASSLTRQLLAFSRQETIERRVIDLNEVARRFERILRRLIGEHIVFTMQLDDAPLPILADPGQIEQVLLNLAVNARDAMPTGGSLTVSTASVWSDGRPGLPAGWYALSTVKDTGSGIPPDVKARLFEAFFTTKSHGTGLGLSTVQAIVQTEGGFIEVESEPGNGATFRVYLPQTKQAAAEATVAFRSTSPGTGTLLMVEDNDQLRQLLRRMLENAGYEVLAARDAVEAERIAAGRNGAIDLLLTDVVLPGKSGPELATALKARRPGLRVLFATGYFGDDVAAHGLRRDHVLLVQKPFTAGVLLQAVERALHEPAAPGAPV